MNRDAAKALADDIFDLAQREGGLIKDSLVDLLERSIDDSAMNRELRNENGILYAENLALRSRVGRINKNTNGMYEIAVYNPHNGLRSRQVFFTEAGARDAANALLRAGYEVKRA